MFKKDQDEATVLRTIKMESGKKAARHLSEVTAVDLGDVEFAEYVGAVSGYKARSEIINVVLLEISSYY